MHLARDPNAKMYTDKMCQRCIMTQPFVTLDQYDFESFEGHNSLQIYQIGTFVFNDKDLLTGAVLSISKHLRVKGRAHHIRKRLEWAVISVF